MKIKNKNFMKIEKKEKNIKLFFKIILWTNNILIKNFWVIFHTFQGTEHQKNFAEFLKTHKNLERQRHKQNETQEDTHRECCLRTFAH